MSHIHDATVTLKSADDYKIAIRSRAACGSSLLKGKLKSMLLARNYPILRLEIPFWLLGIVLAWCQMRVSRLHPISKSGRHQMLPWEEEFLSRFDEDTIIDIAEGAIYMEVQSLLSTCYQVMKGRCCASPEDKVISKKIRPTKSLNETLSERLERWNAWQNRAYWQAKLNRSKDDSLEPQGQPSSGKTKQCVDARKPSTNRRLRLENTRGTKSKTGNPWRKLQERKRGFCGNGKIVYQEKSGH